MLLARSVMAWALLAGVPDVSGETSCALALATEAGIRDDWIAAESSAAASADFLSAVDLSATLPDLWCAYFFRWWCFATAAGAAELSGAVAACDAAPRQIQITVVSINAARPPALLVILAVSPIAPPTKRE